jgi:zeaxanthin glucosyltransferase
MRIAFVALSAPGHLNPTTALARRLQSRNHDVVVISLPDAEPYVNAAGLAFLPYCENAFSAASGNEIRRRLSELQGEDGVRFTVEALGHMMEAVLSSLRAALATAGADAVVLDTSQYYVELIPISLGLPYVHVSNALHFDYSGYTPLCVYDWPHETTPAALTRNRKGVANFARMLKQANATVRAYAERAGLKIDWDDPGSTLSPLASITQVPRAFDFESSHWPSRFHHTGPFHDGMAREKVDFFWERLTGEPLIYASMGTVMNGRVDAFRTIVAALTKHKDLQLVVEPNFVVRMMNENFSRAAQCPPGIYSFLRFLRTFWDTSVTRLPPRNTSVANDLRTGDSTAQKQLACLYGVSLQHTLVLRSDVEITQPPLQR